MSLQHLDIDLRLEHDAWMDALPDLEQLARMVCIKTLEFAGYRRPTMEISLVFADDAFVQNLNREYRGKDKPTNVLSFPQTDPADLSPDEDFLVLGDIILAFETTEREAQESEKPLRHHAAHLIAHGLLHLLAYDHENEKDAQEMENLEVKILKTFSIPNPYEDPAKNTGFMQ